MPATRFATLTVAMLLLVACGSSGEGVAADEIEQSSATSETTTNPPSSTTTVATTTTTEPARPTTTISVPDPVPIESGDGWELVWNDEFDGTEIDTSNWTYDLGGWGWGNGEAQFYTDRSENARVENGLLVIEARQEQYEDSYYTSARLKTQGLQEFQYGRIEARMKVPAGAGVWPAFWMLGANFEEEAEDEANRWPNVGEIDIMEYIGREPDLIMGTIHGPGYSGAGGLSKWFRQDYNIADDWHTYAIEWDADGISWFYDGELYNTKPADSLRPHQDWVFDAEFFIIVNLALGGILPGPIAPDLEFPVYLHVDHVRVYQAIES